MEDEFILNEFRKTLRRNAEKDVVDLDNSFQHKFEYIVLQFENVLRDTNRIIPPHRWSYQRIALIKKGSGDIITGMYNFKATQNTLVVIPSRVINSSKNWTHDTEGYLALFNIDFFLQNNFPHKYVENKKILSSPTQPYIHLTDKQTDEVAHIFKTILTEKTNDKANKNELIALKIIELLILSDRLFDEQLHFEANLPTIDIIKRFCELVENNFIQQRTVKFYAERLNMHPNYLNSLVKKHTGATAKESIQNRLLLETKYLLHSTNLSIKEISNQVGFNDPNYFTSFFTKGENMSPGNYRSQFV